MNPVVRIILRLPLRSAILPPMRSTNTVPRLENTSNAATALYVDENLSITVNGKRMFMAPLVSPFASHATSKIIRPRLFECMNISRPAEMKDSEEKTLAFFNRWPTAIV